MWIVTQLGNLINTDHVIAIHLAQVDDTDIWKVEALCSRREISARIFSSDQVSCARFLETLSKQMESNTSGVISVKHLLNE
jgi:hypothetical protein